MLLCSDLLSITIMNEISYTTYCMFGALRNPQLSRRELCAANGRFVKTRYYHDSRTGILIYPSFG